MILFDRKDLMPDAEIPEDAKSILDKAQLSGRGFGKTLGCTLSFLVASNWKLRRMSVFGSKYRKMMKRKRMQDA